jgi:alpha-tubulin suppressor-like RCC1 family protein
MDFGEANPRYRPSRFDEVPALVEIAAGSGHACGRTEDGSLYCWGNNAFGQLGHPPDVRGGAEGAAKVEGLPPVTGVALGSYFSCAIAGEGAAAEAYCWGDNGWGQLGDGTTPRRHAPVRVVLR